MTDYMKAKFLIQEDQEAFGLRIDEEFENKSWYFLLNYECYNYSSLIESADPFALHSIRNKK